MESLTGTPETTLTAYESSVPPPQNHDVYDCYHVALARDADADGLVTTDRDFEQRCADEPFGYTNPVPEEVLTDRHGVS